MTVSTRDTQSPAKDRLLPEFFRALVEGVPEAIIVASVDGTVTYFNPASEKLLGYDQTEVVGRNIAMLVPQQPDRRADAMKWLDRWAHESDDAQSRFLDLIAQAKSGKQMPVDVRVVERQVAGERRYFITLRDNTARRREPCSFTNPASAQRRMPLPSSRSRVS